VAKPATLRKSAANPATPRKAAARPGSAGSAARPATRKAAGQAGPGSGDATS
jgi:hypothetical protein